MNDPTSRLEDLLAQPITIAGGLRAMVCDTVTFQPADEPAGDFRIQHPDINSISRDAYLRYNAHSAARQLGNDLGFKRRLGKTRLLRDDTVQPTVLRIAKEVAE